jgi:hypothetical protein
MMDERQFWLKSSLFEIESGEDERTNPGCYGKQLATWLRSKLIEKGYNVEELIAEDWGWCVMCGREPFLLWVGCGSVLEHGPQLDAPPLRGKDVTWSCFVAAEKPFLRGLFKRMDTTAAVEKLYKQVEGILKAEPAITLVAEP